MTPDYPPPLRLDIDGDALVANWRWLKGRMGGAACGAAVKADGYGLGAREAVARLAAAGCRDFFVSNWAEAAALAPIGEGLSLAVLHGVDAGGIAAARALGARPVLVTPAQVAAWKAAGGGACDVMVDTGMNRLGLTPAEARSGLLDGLAIDTLMSHLACADEPGHPLTAAQHTAFRALAAAVPARRYSLANSAGICLGADYGFDLVRPGLALYGGIPRPEAEGHIRAVAHLSARIVQKRLVPGGDSVGYGATWAAAAETPLLVLNIGYADGYRRAFGNRGTAIVAGQRCPVVGRVSMDLTTVAVPRALWNDAGEGDWVTVGYELAAASAASGISQYELLTGLGRRYQRRWT